MEFCEKEHFILIDLANYKIKKFKFVSNHKHQDYFVNKNVVQNGRYVFIIYINSRKYYSFL